MKKFLTAVLIFGIVTVISAPGFFTPTAKAQVAGVMLVSDPTLQNITTAAKTQSVWQWVQDNLLKVALSALKKRIIDTMTDQIITWINGGGSPKFIQNFGQGVFQPALNQAVGDTAQAILPTLCSPFSFKVNLELTAPSPQVQPSSCTLNSIVANFNDFWNRFDAGGVIGYYELLAPQNNQYGVDIITQDTLYNNAQQVTAQNVLQTQVNVGFQSQSCVSWRLIKIQGGTPVGSQTVPAPSNLTDQDNPPSPISGTPNFLDPALVAPGVDPTTLQWKCADLKISTPGAALAEGLNKSLYANLDLTISDPDITNAIAMIADAAFNRLIKAGVQGLQGVILSATNGGQPSSGPNAPSPESLTNNTSTITAANNYTNTINTALQSQYMTQLNQAASSLADASTTLATASSTNQTLITTLGGPITGLIGCLGTNPVNPDYGWAQENLTIAVSSTPAALQQAAVQVTSSTVSVNTLIGIIGDPNVTSSTLNSVDSSNVANLTMTAANLDSNVQIMLSGIQITLAAAQNKQQQCEANR